MKHANSGIGEGQRAERRSLVPRRGGFVERLKRRAATLKERQLEDAAALSWLEAFAAETPSSVFGKLAAAGLLAGVSESELLELFRGNAPFTGELYD
ncbi:hypothetical protein [Truepera radiovictrix]|nr:hypothetical protein [Truepera radiovictrix]WMT58584.1 hypothetical protein RCV51_06470 [Truepera radiovictrix]